MQVDHKLIEKYHLNQCTPEERNLVEEWLIDDTLDFPSLPFLKQTSPISSQKFGKTSVRISRNLP